MSDLMVNNLNLALDDGSTSYADLLAGLVEFDQLTPLLALVPALSAALRAQRNAVVVMQPCDLLAEFGLTQIDTGEDDAAYTSRLTHAADWLASNARKVEEAMTQAGFDAMSVLADGPAPFKIGPMPK